MQTFDILTLVNIKITVFWHVTPPARYVALIGETYCFHPQGTVVTFRFRVYKAAHCTLTAVSTIQYHLFQSSFVPSLPCLHTWTTFTLRK
jgi:hypothetical protein